VRRIDHPGPIARERHAAISCRAEPVTLTLRAGLSFGATVAQAFAEHGHKAGYLRLSDVAMERLGFVMPAPAPGDGHAAWYSAAQSWTGGAVIHEAGVHLGQRDGAPFTHIHGRWSGVGTGERVGHLLPDASVIARDTLAQGWALTGAILVAEPDPETQFTLFRAREWGPAPETVNALLCTLRPNQDISGALVALASAYFSGPVRAEGIGSLIGTRFENGVGIDAYATEVLLTEGRIADGDGCLYALAVGFDGRHASGRLVSGDNPVLVTAEILLIVS
jgi:hypothetical protein